MGLVAYFNDQAVKEKFVSRARSHREQDRIVQGWGYWNKGIGRGVDAPLKGCAVGCTLEQDNAPGGIHAQYETQLGVPRILARLEDGIFENLPKDRAMTWPEEFLAAIPVGADLSGVWPQFAVWLLIDEQYGVKQFARSEAARTAIQQVADLYSRASAPTLEEWRAARSAAYAADADDAAAYAAYAAAAAAYAAYAAAAAADADAKRYEWRNAQADKLIELMAAAPIAATVN